MADANIVITGVTLTPNPVKTGGQYKIEAEIRPVIFVLADNDGAGITDDDGTLIDTDMEG